MDIEKLQLNLGNNIVLNEFREHGKASEKYIDVTFLYEGESFSTSIPYHYRRLGIFIDNEDSLLDLLSSVYSFCELKYRNQWAKEQIKLRNTEYVTKGVTKPFFEKLLSFNWCEVQKDLPNNPNRARRIQDIKEMGYMLATNTSMKSKYGNYNATHIILIPFDKGTQTGYEQWDQTTRNRIIKKLGNTNVYELSTRTASSLIPDHKFPEIRRDDTTRRESLKDITDDEIIRDFQIVDNQRNQQKREVCRKCFQTGERGKLYGINFFYEGGERRDEKIPKIGKSAEKGCIGCGRYDIQKRREELNKRINDSGNTDPTHIE